MSARYLRLVKLRDDVKRQGKELLFRLGMIEDMINAEIVEERDLAERTRSSSCVVGMPCVAEVAWLGDAPIVRPALSDDSSAAIPAEVIEKLDRCAE